MGENTEISWCDHTFNPWLGCTKVSRACDFCYAEAYAKRIGKPELWQGERRRTSQVYWRQPIKWNRDAAAAGVRRRVFCASLADVFDNQTNVHWRDELWTLISVTPRLDWLLLTKRPQNIRHMLPHGWDGGWPNVWLGTTTENQEEFDRRYPYLAALPARVHFISYEPALGPLSLERAYPVPDWVICGGESGAHARPMDPNWARDVRDDCTAAGVAFHFKQWGGLRPKSGGRLLDGREWNEFPEARHG